MAGSSLVRRAVVEQDDPVAEGAGLDQAQVGAGVDGQAPDLVGVDLADDGGPAVR
jgi:hypothetical protein